MNFNSYRFKIRQKISVLRKSFRGTVFGNLLKMDGIENCYPNITKIPHPVRRQTLETKEILQMNVINSAVHFKNSEYITPEYFSAILDNVNFNAQEGVLFNDQNMIVKESVNSVKDVRRFRWSTFILSKKYEIYEYAIPFRSVSNEFYHTLFSNLPRLFALHHEPYNEISKIKLLVQDKLSSMEEIFLSKLLPSNVEIELIKGKGIYKLKRCIFLPFLNQQYAGYLPSEYLEFFHSKLLPSRQRKNDKKIFISRELTTRRRILNEDKLFGRLKSLGFKKYNLEALSIEEQISLFYDAEVVFALHGAGLANLIYCENASVIEVFPHNRVKPTFYFLSKSRNCDYTYYCATNTIGAISDDVEVDVDELFAIVEKQVH